LDIQQGDPSPPAACYSTKGNPEQGRKAASSSANKGWKRFKHFHPQFYGGFVTTKIDPDTTILHVPLPNAEFDYLAQMRGTRKWRTFFKDIQDDARKAAENNQELRRKIEFLETRLKRDKDG